MRDLLEHINLEVAPSLHRGSLGARQPERPPASTPQRTSTHPHPVRPPLLAHAPLLRLHPRPVDTSHALLTVPYPILRRKPYLGRSHRRLCFHVQRSSASPEDKAHGGSIEGRRAARRTITPIRKARRRSPPDCTWLDSPPSPERATGQRNIATLSRLSRTRHARCRMLAPRRLPSSRTPTARAQQSRLYMSTVRTSGRS